VQQKAASWVSGTELTTSSRNVNLIPGAEGESVCDVSTPERSSAVYLRGPIPHGDHDRWCDPTELTTKEAAYALAIGATANIMFVVGATAMLLAFALAYSQPGRALSLQ
jgi:hypothetical protein